MGGQAWLVLCSFNIYCSSARCPLVLAVAGPRTPQQAHPSSEATPTPLAPSHHGEGDSAGAGSRRWRKRSPAISCSLLICTVQLQTPSSARWCYGPTATARLCPATPCLHRPVPAQGRQDCSSCTQARKFQSQLNCGFFQFSSE